MAYPNFLYSSKLYSETPVRTGAFLVAYYSSSDKANDVKSLFVCPPDGDSWTYCGKNDIYTELESTSVSLDYSNVDLGVAKFYDCTSDLTSLTVTNTVSDEEPQTTMFVKFKAGEGFQLNLEGFTYLDEEVGTIPDLAEGYTYLLTIRNGFVTIDSSLRLDLTSATNEDIDNIFEESETSEDIKLLINVSNLRHFWNIAKESSKQSDWDQNEESEADYIKNRTHWKEETVIQDAKHIDETNYDDQREITRNLMNVYENIQLTPELIIGTTITFNGADYQLTEENRADSHDFVSDETQWFFGKYPLFGNDVDVFVAQICQESTYDELYIEWFSNDVTIGGNTMPDKTILITIYEGEELEYSWDLPTLKGFEYHKLNKEYVDVDWDENNEESVSHIKHRTHWKEHIIEDARVLNLENYDEWDEEYSYALYKNVKLTESALINSTITAHYIDEGEPVEETITLTNENRSFSLNFERGVWYFGTLYDAAVNSRGISPDEIEQMGYTDLFKSSHVYADAGQNIWSDNAIGYVMLNAHIANMPNSYTFLQYYEDSNNYAERTLNAINEYIYHKIDPNYLPENIQPDWNQSDSSKPDFIKNKPSIPTKTSDLINDGDSSYPNDPFVRQSEIKQADWEQNEESEADFIKHRTHYEYGRIFSSSDSDYTVISKDGTDFYYFDYVFNNVSELDNRLLNITYYNGSYNVKSKLVYIEVEESEYSEAYTLGYNIGEGFTEAGIYLPNQTIIDGVTYEAGLYIIKGVTGDVNPYVTEFTISKCIEKLNNKFLNIDDRYYPNSENPQSGKAVAEAIGTVTELIPNGTSSSNQLVNNSQLNDVIDQNAKDYIAPDASMVVPFEYCTYVGGTTNLENGPWYKGGVECGTGQDPVYVVEGDYALVMKDESVCYFEAFGYRYQRHKDGGQTPFGYVVLPDVQHTTTNIAQISGGIYDGALYFVDNTRTFNADNDLLFIVTNLSVLTNSVHMFYASQPSEISGDPITRYDLRFPSTRYRCSIAQTATNNPTWSFMYFVNDTPLTGEYLQVLNSNITAEKVDKLDSIDISHTTTSGLENYTTVTIVVGNKTESFKIYSIDQNFSKSNSKNPVSTAAVYNELSKRVNKTDFENVVKDVVHIDQVTGDAYLIDDSSDLNYEKAHSIYNVYATITSNNLVLVQDGIDNNTYFYIFDVDNINDNLYLSVRSAQRLRLCLVSDNVDDTAEKVKTRIEGYGHGTGQKYTYHGTWAINLGNDKTYTDNEPYVIDNSGAKHAKVLIIYVGNNDVTPIIRASAGARMDAFLSSVDPDSTNAIQSQAVDKALKDIIVEGYYYNNKFWSDSQHTEEITGVANKLYVDISSNTIYKYVNQSFTKATASLQWGNF